MHIVGYSTWPLCLCLSGRWGGVKKAQMEALWHTIERNYAVIVWHTMREDIQFLAVSLEKPFCVLWSHLGLHFWLCDMLTQHATDSHCIDIPSVTPFSLGDVWWLTCVYTQNASELPPYIVTHWAVKWHSTVCLLLGYYLVLLLVTM